MTGNNYHSRYEQTDIAGQPAQKGDHVDVRFCEDGEEISFSIYINCDGLSCQETITQDGRYQYVYGKKVERPPLTAILCGDGSSYRHTFETSKGRARIILKFDPHGEGQTLEITHYLPDQAPLTRSFIRLREKPALRIAA